jgi:peptide/nickel transport system ATP-binding protein
MVDANLRVQILEILDKVRREMRVSFLYISHDLSTVYQIADDIFVMNGGLVVEHGRARDVIADPTHPYTRLLLDATPSPDTRVRW